MSVKNVTVHEAKAAQAEGATYVDVRSVPEFAQGHPAGAVNVPLLHRDPDTGQMSPNTAFVSVMKAAFPPNAKLLIGCQVGGRSAQAAQILDGYGFEDVTNVLGGYGGARDPITGSVRAEGWAPAGLPVEIEEEPGASYERMRNGSGGGK